MVATPGAVGATLRTVGTVAPRRRAGAASSDDLFFARGPAYARVAVRAEKCSVIFKRSGRRSVGRVCRRSARRVPNGNAPDLTTTKPTEPFQEVFAVHNPRPISPHLGIYRWRINMVQSSLHRLTGLLLSVGTLVFTWGLIAAASSGHAWQMFADFSGSWIGLIVWFAWIWVLLFHLCNGIQHLLHSLAWDYGPQAMRDRTHNPSYWTTGWVVVGASTALTVLTWILLVITLKGGAA